VSNTLPFGAFESVGVTILARTMLALIVGTGSLAKVGDSSGCNSACVSAGRHEGGKLRLRLLLSVLS
jgi:hypothetical protein